MTCIFSSTITPTIDQLIEKFGSLEYKGQLIEAWVFDDKKNRQRAEAAFLKLGIIAKLRSAYKPLLHFFLEEVTLPLKGLVRVEVHYPVHRAASDKRFLLEAYPLAALIEGAEIEFIASQSLQDSYDVILQSSKGDISRHSVFAPNHLHLDLIDQEHLSPTGWLKITGNNDKTSTNERLTTDYETLFIEGMKAVSEYAWGNTSPYFEELNIQVFLPWQDQALPYKHEVISLTEALHEDFYFSLQEWFKVKAGHLPHERDGQAGQIVPDIRYSEENTLRLKIETRPYQLEQSKGRQTLDQAKTSISMQQIESELEQINEDSFEVQTVTGRSVHARYHKGSDFPVMISGGQHANETSGVIGALRAAQILKQQKSSHFTISPLENPDGYALHQRLISHNPHHMHHAARYTALGDDLEYRTKGRLYEKEIRHKARKLSHANLHINLHGYPSHEWTRPLSGYVPHGFDMWTIPKGFFLILRHSSEKKWGHYAEKFIHLVTSKLIKMPGVQELNREQIELYKQHAGQTNFRIINDFPCLISEGKPDDIPIQLITEYPDETLSGNDFIMAHTVQTATVLAAYEIHQLLSSKND